MDFVDGPGIGDRCIVFASSILSYIGRVEALIHELKPSRLYWRRTVYNFDFLKCLSSYAYRKKRTYRMKGP